MSLKIKNFLLNYFFLFFDIYLISLFIDLSSFSCDYSSVAVVSKVVRIISYLYFLARLIILFPIYKKKIIDMLKKYSSFKLLFLIFIIFIVAIIINFCLYVKNRRFLYAILILLAAYQADYKKIIKHIFCIQIIMTSIFVLGAISGLTQNYMIHRGSILRYSLGYIYPTFLAQMILFSSILYIYIKQLKVSVEYLAIIQILNFFTYFITNSRTEFFLLEVIIFGLLMYSFFPLFFEKRKSNLKKILELLTYTFPIFPALTLVVSLLYPLGGILNKLNSLLSGRVYLFYINVKTHGLSLFGNNVELLGNGLKTKMKYGDYQYNYIDSEYLQVLFQNGIIVGIAFIIILYILLIMLYKDKKYIELSVCLVYLFFGLINPRIINFAFSPVLFLIIPTISEFYKGAIK